jgi:D-lactate dehydrogenase
MNEPLTNESIIEELRTRLGNEQVLSRLIERTAYAGDASIYRLVPVVVVRPRDYHDIQVLLEFCRKNALHLTFRAAGTSLSGQAVTDGILVDVAYHWKGLRILDGGGRVAAQPGVIGSHVNAHLARHRAKMGPDPASINACMMGGIVANNASGMCCGVRHNSYNTMSGMQMVLADGFYLDTSQGDPDATLKRERPTVWAGLQEIRSQILADPALCDRIRRKFSIKNTCGYSMNAFVDFERSVDMLSHLLIGSEGTLGFIGEITLETLPDKPLKATALVFFRELPDAGAAIGPLAEAGAAVLEIMDRAAMLSVADEMKYPFQPEGNCAALLVEFQEEDEAELASRLRTAGEILTRYQLLAPVEFTRDPAIQEELWHMRKGLFPSVGAMREMGTAVLIEDVAVHFSRLAECIVDLQGLFVKHAYADAIIFGHAKDGNLHFVICNDFADEEQIARYADLMAALTQLIVRKYDGSLKAEHGTGRNIAPFVELEWGAELTGLMWKVKKLLDPNDILNPGVILNRDPKAHLLDLKTMPVVTPVVDKCIECGFCEPKCPSRDLTLTPRQRIAVRREMTRLTRLGDAESLATAGRLRAEFKYDGLDTCAGDSMCSTACPVKIDTGAMVKNLRAEATSPMARRVARMIARHYGWAAMGARIGLRFLRLTGKPGFAFASFMSGLMYRMSNGALPRLPKNMPMPDPAPRLPSPKANNGSGDHRVVYYASCLTRSMGRLPGERADVGLAQAVVEVLEKCGWTVIIPREIQDTCCGQPFFSKSFYQASADALAATVEMLHKASDGGRIPILCDTSPCSGHLMTGDRILGRVPLAKWKSLQFHDFPSFMSQLVLPSRDKWPRLPRQIVLHPTCTLIKIGGLEPLRAVASAFAESVIVPIHAECCGFAGDKGFSLPELTRSATRAEGAEVAAIVDTAAEKRGPTGFYSTCRTCEIGMTAATGQVYQSIVYLCYDALNKK